MADKKTVYETLSKIDFKKHIKELQGNDYIPWADAWFEVKESYPTATHEILCDDVGNPFFVSPMGIFVKVKVSIDDESQVMTYPVMNGANKALKVDQYSYKVKEYVNRQPTGKFIDKYVEPATSFDINTAIQRALTKCIAVMGGGLYVYRGEVMPEPELITSSQIQEIIDTAKEVGITITYISEKWNVGKIANFHEANFDTVIDWIRKHKK